ncbi:hypothetical protein AXG93_2253s1000 [Marchantia polymorpha subsp. ruderalis]|uniref:Uncharacterized protein n=1 Tax=Marchantia polymorpha subsp. ruderalis TaxID=1480154 RepID=A0A176VS55_MARPO|nr:hypothetical protein AXG93_2253s1000 [Marchantia polymorpha subsp. ruderalis]
MEGNGMEDKLLSLKQRLERHVQLEGNSESVQIGRTDDDTITWVLERDGTLGWLLGPSTPLHCNRHRHPMGSCTARRPS